MGNADVRPKMFKIRLVTFDSDSYGRLPRHSAPKTYNEHSVLQDYMAAMLFSISCPRDRWWSVTNRDNGVDHVRLLE